MLQDIKYYYLLISIIFWAFSSAQTNENSAVSQLRCEEQTVAFSNLKPSKQYRILAKNGYDPSLFAHGDWSKHSKTLYDWFKTLSVLSVLSVLQCLIGHFWVFSSVLRGEKINPTEKKMNYWITVTYTESVGVGLIQRGCPQINPTECLIGQNFLHILIDCHVQIATAHHENHSFTNIHSTTHYENITEPIE